MTAADKCLFLDFDGVLHPSLCRPRDYFGRVRLLEAALGAFPVDIVISSSWRFHHDWVGSPGTELEFAL